MRVFAFFLMPLDDACTCGNVSAGRSAGGNNPIGVYSQFSRILANPSDCRFSILDALEGGSLMRFANPVFCRHSHKSKICETRLLFVVSALKQLFRDENFINLLRAEGLDTLPQFLADRIDAKDS